MVLPLFLFSLTKEEFKNYTQKIENSAVAFEMIAIEGGDFLLGASEDEKEHDTDEVPQKKVSISPFWMGATEVTYDEYQLFFEEKKDPSPKVDAITRPSPPYIDFTLGMGKIGGYPANSMQQYAALMYCKWLYQKTGIFYRLPTEAEWEYAAKLGLKNIDIKNISFSDFAWYDQNAEGKYHKVKEKKPNALGLYDMYGNVAEWTMDQYNNAYYTTLIDGTKDPINTKTKRHPCTVKGGHYGSPLKDLRPEHREPTSQKWNQRDPQIPKSKWWNADAPFVGFRVVRPLQQPNKEQIEIFFNTHLI